MAQGKIIAYYEMNMTTHEIAVRMQLPEEEVQKVIEGLGGEGIYKGKFIP